MKKVLLVLVILLAAGLSYWNWPGPAPELPVATDIERVEVTPSEPMRLKLEGTYPAVFKDPMTVEEKEKIADLLSYLSKGRKTRESSVNDQPYVTPYVRFYLVLKDGTDRGFYVYEDGGITYLEVPYEGIYKLNHPLENWLAENW